MNNNQDESKVNRIQFDIVADPLTVSTFATRRGSVCFIIH